jgi:polyhydroxyalkanoate synthesis repressor PhaR
MSQPLKTEPGMAHADATTGDAKAGEQPAVVVKKYANRRLYNTESSSYITLDTLAEMVRSGRDFVVYDAKTGEDITRSVLTQIIVEEESKGRAMLPTGFLRRLIGFYGDQMQTLVPRYLEQAMASFARQQDQMRVAMQQTMGNFFPFGSMEEVGRQNFAMMERAMSLFTPFYREPEPVDTRPPAAASLQDEVKTLRAEVEFLRAQLSRLRATQPLETRPDSSQTPDQNSLMKSRAETEGN